MSLSNFNIKFLRFYQQVHRPCRLRDLFQPYLYHSLIVRVKYHHTCLHIVLCFLKYSAFLETPLRLCLTLKTIMHHNHTKWHKEKVKEENVDKVRSTYTVRKEKRIFWLLKRRNYYKNKFCLDTSNLYPLIPTIKFLNLISVDDAFHLPWRHCHVSACIDYTWRKLELENKSLSKVMDRWIIFRLNDNSWSTFPICNGFRCEE